MRSITLDDVTTAASTLGGTEDFSQRAERFLVLIRTWASPSAVLCLRRARGETAAWAVVKELTTIAGFEGQEASLARQVEQSAPGPITEPKCIRPAQEFAGINVKPRDSWVIPWTTSRASGYLLLRSLASPYPVNLASATALLASQLWVMLPEEAAPSAGRGSTVEPNRLQTVTGEIEGLARGLREAVRLVENQAKASPSPQVEPGAEAESRAALEAERDREHAVAREARTRAEALERQAADDHRRYAEEKANFEAERKRDRESARRISERLEATKREFDQERARHTATRQSADKARDGEKIAARQASERIAGLEKQLEQEQARHAEEDRASGKQTADARAAALAKELDEARSQHSEDKTKLEQQLEQERARHADERAALEAERDRATRASEEAPQDSASAAVEAGRDKALQENKELRARAEELQAELDNQRRQADSGVAPSAGERAAELERARRRTTELQKRIETLENAATEAEAERARLRSETAEERSRGEALKTTLEAERVRAEADRQGLEAARQAVKAGESLLAQQRGELEATRRQRGELQGQMETAQKARVAAEAERDRARAEVNPLWGTIESLQRQVEEESQKRTVENEALAQARKATEKARADLEAAGQEKGDKSRRLEEAEQQAGELSERWEQTVNSLRAALTALRRTPFVPPTLRVSFSGTESIVGPEKERPVHRTADGRRSRILFVDRDTPGLEALAAELEELGVEVLIAHYPEEVSFFLKTPDARNLTAIVSDVMAFRSDADLLDRLQTWRQEEPGLAMIVSYRGDDTSEAERARRLPSGAGQIKRPMTCEPLLEVVASFNRRRPTEAGRVGAPRR